MALNLAPFGRWTQRDKAALRRLALRFIVPTLRRGNAARDAPASRYATLERCMMRFHAGAWER